MVLHLAVRFVTLFVGSALVGALMGALNNTTATTTTTTTTTTTHHYNDNDNDIDNDNNSDATNNTNSTTTANTNTNAAMILIINNKAFSAWLFKHLRLHLHAREHGTHLELAVFGGSPLSIV